MDTLEILQQKLIEINHTLEVFYAECQRTDGFHINPAGDIGGIRSRSRKVKGQMFDRWTKQAHEGVELEKKKKLLLNQIAWVTAAPLREKRDINLLIAWDNLEPGMEFRPGNDALKIIRKNKYSITTTGGINWSVVEVIGLSRKRIEELRLKQSKLVLDNQ